MLRFSGGCCFKCSNIQGFDWGDFNPEEDLVVHNVLGSSFGAYHKIAENSRRQKKEIMEDELNDGRVSRVSVELG